MITLVSILDAARFRSVDRILVVATLNPATMETLQLFRGDTIIVRCASNHEFDDSSLIVQEQRKETSRYGPYLS